MWVLTLLTTDFGEHQTCYFFVFSGTSMLLTWKNLNFRAVFHVFDVEANTIYKSETSNYGNYWKHICNIRQRLGAGDCCVMLVRIHMTITVDKCVWSESLTWNNHLSFTSPVVVFRYSVSSRALQMRPTIQFLLFVSLYLSTVGNVNK